MIASDNTEFAWVVLTLVIVLGVGALIVKNKIDSVKIKAGPVEASVDMASLHQQVSEIRTMASSINDAVNHRKDGEPTLVQRVENIEANQAINARHQHHERAVLEWQNTALARIAGHVGLHVGQPPSEPEDWPIIERRKTQ